MFKVKATLISFAGDVERYPCHFGYEVGDEIIYDGENFIGRICLQVIPLLNKYVPPLYSVGPRYVNPFSYFPFFYSPLSTRDPGQKKYDGLGFKIVKKKIIEPKYHMANFKSPNAFKWPVHDKRDIAKDLVGRCDDLRTAATFKFEAFDLCDKGDAVPYFRKQMLILKKVVEKPGIRADRIINNMSKKHVEEIYPGLNPVLMEVLVEELEAIGFVTIRDSGVSATDRGEAKLSEFTSSLTMDEREALGPS
jgi:uncharacterized repeat protein (TIGR04076 family)